MNKPEETKKCAFCGKEFSRPLWAKYKKQWNKLKYCSSSCASKDRTYPRATLKDKYCQCCGKRMVATPNFSPSSWAKRKYCSQTCAYTKLGWKTGSEHPSWKGGDLAPTSQGYVFTWVNTSKYQLKHRVIMEYYLGRKLTKKEIVHHINGDKQDNNIENLVIMTVGSHTRLHSLGTTCSAETKDYFKKIRKGTHQKENHNQWRKDLTKEKILEVFKKHGSFQKTAKELNFGHQSLVERIKYFGIFDEIKAMNKWYIGRGIEK